MDHLSKTIVQDSKNCSDSSNPIKIIEEQASDKSGSGKDAV